jgi:hypothetical protein
MLGALPRSVLSGPIQVTFRSITRTAAVRLVRRPSGVFHHITCLSPLVDHALVRRIQGAAVTSCPHCRGAGYADIHETVWRDA